MLKLLGADPGGERRDRLEPEHLIDRARNEFWSLPHRLPLPRVGGEQPERVRELRGRRVDAAGQDVEHQVDALGPGQPLALCLDP